VEASEVAYKAAEIMSSKGHCKNALEDGEGRVCFLGAVLLAQNGGMLRRYPWDDAVDRILDCAEAVLADRGTILSPVTFNNLSETSAEDVILLLKETGKRLEK
jgi:hypothetical protein